jgi:hypothetical protein
MLPLLLLCLAAPRDAEADPGRAAFRAFSLRQASREALREAGGEELRTLGGITRLAGFVFDRASGDVILVGDTAPGLPGLRFDDLVTALRARILQDEWPLVSIDPVPGSDVSGMMQVRFNGLEDTSMGHDLLDCDIFLKGSSLDDANSEVPSYRRLLADEIRAEVSALGARVLDMRWEDEGGEDLLRGQVGTPVAGAADYQARFWFYSMDPYRTTGCGDVFCIKELVIGVRSEKTLFAKDCTGDRARAKFASEWTVNLPALCNRAPVLRRLKGAYDLVAVAEAIRSCDPPLDLRDLLREYPVPVVATRRDVPLRVVVGLVERSDRLRHLIRLSGGIDLRTAVQLLNYGDLGPLKDIVLACRPSLDALSWSLAVTDWTMPNSADLNTSVQAVPSHAWEDRTCGCFLSCQSVVLARAGEGPAGQPAFEGFPAVVCPAPLRGVSMRMEVTDGSFRPAVGDALQRVRQDVLKQMKRRGTMCPAAPSGKEK